MQITFVMGMACSGKSSYIKKHFPNATIIDLYDFQKNKPFLGYEEVVKSYEECKEAVLEAIKRGEDVVMEHTLLKAIRRKPYIDAIREITDAPIDIVLINPEIYTLAARCRRRGIYNDENYLRKNLEILEIPTKEEGFDNITIIEDKEQGFENIFKDEEVFNNLDDNYLSYIFMDNIHFTVNYDIKNEQLKQLKSSVEQLLKINNFKIINIEKDKISCENLVVNINTNKIEFVLDRQPYVDIIDINKYMKNFTPVIRETFTLMLNKNIIPLSGKYFNTNSVCFKNYEQLSNKFWLRNESLPKDIDNYKIEKNTKLSSRTINTIKKFNVVDIDATKYIKLTFNLQMDLYFDKTTDKLNLINETEDEVKELFSSTFNPFNNQSIVKIKNINFFTN